MCGDGEGEGGKEGKDHPGLSDTSRDKAQETRDSFDAETAARAEARNASPTPVPGYAGLAPVTRAGPLGPASPFDPRSNVGYTPGSTPGRRSTPASIAANNINTDHSIGQKIGDVFPGFTRTRDPVTKAPELSFNIGRAGLEALGLATGIPGAATLAEKSFNAITDNSMAVNPGPQDPTIDPAEALAEKNAPQSPALDVAGSGNNRRHSPSSAPSPREIAAALQSPGSTAQPAPRPGYTRPGGINFGNLSESQLRAIFT